MANIEKLPKELKDIYIDWHQSIKEDMHDDPDEYIKKIIDLLPQEEFEAEIKNLIDEPNELSAECSICGNESGYDKETLESSTHNINGIKIVLCCPCEDDFKKSFGIEIDEEE
ncbi:MAG: hypothetical protein ACOCVF_02950 [bacterium]